MQLSGVCSNWVTALGWLPKKNLQILPDVKGVARSRLHQVCIKGECQAPPSPTTILMRRGLFSDTGCKPALDSVIVFEYAITMGEGFRHISLLWHLFKVAYNIKTDEWEIQSHKQELVIL